MIKKLVIILGSILLLIALLALTYTKWLPLPANFLLVKDNVKKADCIIALGGDPYLRIQRAAKLFKEGYAPRIIVPVIPPRDSTLSDYYNFDYLIYNLKDISMHDYAVRAYNFFGVKEENLFFVPISSTTTFSESLASKKFMLDNGFKSLIVVTSGYHGRRALMIFNTVFRGTGIKIFNSTAENEVYNPDAWWRKEDDVIAIMEEYIASVHNIIYHFIFKRGISDFDKQS